MDWIIALVLAGFLLLFAEFFLPGMIVGIAGLCCLIAAVIGAGQSYGPQAAVLLFFGEVAGSLILFGLWVKIFPKIRMGKAVMLSKSVDGVAVTESPLAWVGKKGVALTTLRPAGTAKIDGQRLDVLAESGLIEAGTRVRITKVDGSLTIVCEDH